MQSLERERENGGEEIGGKKIKSRESELRVSLTCKL